MIKRSIVILAALIMAGAAYAKFIPCPANIASAHDGEVIKYKGVSWKVVFVSNKIPVDFPIKISYPGFVKSGTEGKPALACYDDDKRPNRSVGRPLYSLTMIHQDACHNPHVNNDKKGFDCH